MKTIYHGTFFKVNKLSTKNVQNNHRHEYYGNALYFSSNFDIANYYGEKIYKDEPLFHKKQIFKLNVNDSDFVIIDAKKQPIRNVGDKLKELLKKGRNVLIKNVADANYAGRQSKWMDLNQSDAEYKYLNACYVRQEYTILTKKLKELIESAEKIGVRIHSGGMFKTKYLTSANLTLTQAKKLEKLGFKVYKVSSRTPDYSDTYVIQDEKLLSKAVVLK
jgi:hypothetical protein